MLLFFYWANYQRNLLVSYYIVIRLVSSGLFRLLILCLNELVLIHFDLLALQLPKKPQHPNPTTTKINKQKSNPKTMVYQAGHILLTMDS